MSLLFCEEKYGGKMSIYVSKLGLHFYILHSLLDGPISQIPLLMVQILYGLNIFVSLSRGRVHVIYIGLLFSLIHHGICLFLFYFFRGTFLTIPVP